MKFCGALTEISKSRRGRGESRVLITNNSYSLRAYYAPDTVLDGLKIFLLLKCHTMPWLVWLSELIAVGKPKGSRLDSSQGTCLGCWPGPQSMYLTQDVSLPFSPVLPLSLIINNKLNVTTLPVNTSSL